MKQEKNIKKLIRNAPMKTNSKVNEAVLNSLFYELDKSKKADLAISRPSIWRVVIKSRMVKFAAAIVIIAAICLFFTHYSRDRQIETSKITQISELKTPAKLTSLISLNSAFRRGGMEAVEKQFAEAEQKINRGSKKCITTEQMLCELGQC